MLCLPTPLSAVKLCQLSRLLVRGRQLASGRQLVHQSCKPSRLRDSMESLLMSVPTGRITRDATPSHFIGDFVYTIKKRRDATPSHFINDFIYTIKKRRDATPSHFINPSRTEYTNRIQATGGAGRSQPAVHTCHSAW
jgi:hypothetical protein